MNHHVWQLDLLHYIALQQKKELRLKRMLCRGKNGKGNSSSGTSNFEHRIRVWAAAKVTPPCTVAQQSAHVWHLETVH
jgi:hypothetical protein